MEDLLTASGLDDADALVEAASEHVFNGEYESAVNKLQMAMLAAEVEADAMQLMHTSLMALRRHYEAKESALLWGDVLGDSLVQLNALVDAAFMDEDIEDCAAASRKIETFVSEPDDEFDLPPMPASAAAKVRAACLAQDLVYQMIANDPNGTKPEDRVAWDVSDLASQCDEDDFISAIYLRWLNFVNAFISQGDERPALAALVEPFPEAEHGQHHEARALVLALAGTAHLDAGRIEEARECMELAGSLAAHPNLVGLDALLRVTEDKIDDASAMRSRLIKTVERGNILMRRRVAKYIAQE